MTKHELLRKIGFSEEYIAHLKKLENNETYEVIGEEYPQQTSDVTNVIVDESINNFSTKVNMGSK